MPELKGGVSTSNVPCIEVTWKILISAQTSRRKYSCIRSPPFSFAEASWCLVLVPYDYNGEQGAIRIYLERLNSPISEHSVIASMDFNTDSWKEKHGSTEGLVGEKMDFLMLPYLHRSWSNVRGTVTVFCHLRLKTQPREMSLELPVSPDRSLDSSCGNHNTAGNSGATHSTSSHSNSQENPGSNLSKMQEFDGQISTSNVLFIEVIWEIPNFVPTSRKIGYEVESPPFSFAQASWCLELVPNGVKYLPEKMFIGLKRLNSSVSDHSVIAKMGFKTDDHREERNSVCAEGFVDENHNFLQTRYLKRSDVEARGTLLPNGTATVFCQLQLKTQPREALLELPVRQERSQDSSPGNQIIAGNSGATHSALSQPELLNSSPPTHELHPNSSGIHNLQPDYKKLLETEEEADVCLKVSDRELPALKCFLRARSSVFSVMFKDDTEENSGEVVIKGLDPKFFPDFLRHVYAGSVDTLSEENVFSLYTAADKYDMADLKSECKSYMERTLSVDTFCDVMVVALRYKEDELLKCAVDFFSRNLTRIIVTVKWQIFSKEHNTEANELLIKALVPADQK